MYYRAGVRLKSSEHGRISDARCGYTLEFASDDLFLGVHDTVSIDRSGGIGGGQKEILLKTLSNIAGGIYAPEDDIIRVISPLGTSPGAFTGATMTGPAILSKTRLDREFLDDQFPDGGDGPMFKYERVYVLTRDHQSCNPRRHDDGRRERADRPFGESQSSAEQHWAPRRWSDVASESTRKTIAGIG